ncbi:hypothetical protein MASR2M78_31890 [Treponema sp.]
MPCPLCEALDIHPLQNKRRSFFRCDNCGFAWAAPASVPTESSAKERYELHQNDRNTQGYVSYLTTIIDRALLPFLGAELPALNSPAQNSSLKILDWGSGPNPVCAELLQERGYEVSLWDPNFASHAKPKKEDYDLVLCIEVAEHFTKPLEDFMALGACLKPGAFALIHSHLAPKQDEAFLSWWYVEDPTHVSFYTEEALVFLARRLNLILEEVAEGKMALFRRPLPVLVAGGANMDIEGRPFSPLTVHDSNPGLVSHAPGGTARNIAENLARLGIPVEFISAVGKDSAGTELMEMTSATGVGISGIQVIEAERTSTYLSILDAEGDMQVAISGMAIYDSFSQEFLSFALGRAEAAARSRSTLKRDEAPFSALVLDTNLSSDSLRFLLDSLPNLAAWLDPVSTKKTKLFMKEAPELLSRFSWIKPNLIEAQVLAQIEVLEDVAGKPALQLAIESARILHSSGVKAIPISLGAGGVLLVEAGRAYLCQPPELKIVSATGAGDAFLSGALRASLLKAGNSQIVASGCAASAITLASPKACAVDLNATQIESLLSVWRNTGTCTWKEIEL